jgi:hypothetical protein
MVVDEKLLKLPDESLPQIINVFHVGISVIHQFDRHDAVIALGIFLVFTLLALDDTYWPAFDQASRIRRLVHQYQHIDGITVFRFG